MPEAQQTVLGFDFGTRKTGVAIGQTVTGTATPLTTLTSRNQAPDWQGIAELLVAWQPDALVVGLPANMDDSESALGQRARRFARQLEGRFQLPVWLVDERLTTREARAHLGSQLKGMSDPRTDSLAAALLIESYFRDGGTRP